MGTMKGWETRRANQARMDREWEDAVFEAGKFEERTRLRSLLEQSLNALLSSASGNPRLRELAIDALRREMEPK